MSVVVDSRLSARDVFRVSAMLVLRYRLTPTLLLAGPVLAAVGALTGSEQLLRLGAIASSLLVLVPAFALLMGSYAAYRPGATELFEPACWTFTDQGVEIEQPSRTAHADWSEFVRWRRVAGHYLLHTSSRRYVILSGAGLSGEDTVSLEDLLAEHIGPSHR